MQQVDLSLHIYADDINKKVLQHPPASKENVDLDKLRSKLNDSNSIMNTCLLEIGLAQNTSKQ
eukprot:3726965-Pyramimonas_sp.AAC.1